jgi:hypothetical protein
LKVKEKKKKTLFFNAAIILSNSLLYMQPNFCFSSSYRHSTICASIAPLPFKSNVPSNPREIRHKVYPRRWNDEEFAQMVPRSHLGGEFCFGIIERNIDDGKIYQSAGVVGVHASIACPRSPEAAPNID